MEARVLRRHSTMPDRVQALVENEPGALAIATLRGVQRLASGKSADVRDLQVCRGRCPLERSCAIATADCGSAPPIAECCMSTREKRMSLDARTASRPIRGNDVRRPGRRHLGGDDRWALTAFTDLSVPTVSARCRVYRMTPSSPFWWRGTASSGWAASMMDGLDRWNNGRIDVFRKKDGLPDSAILLAFSGRVGSHLGYPPCADSRSCRMASFIPVASVPGVYSPSSRTAMARSGSARAKKSLSHSGRKGGGTCIPLGEPRPSRLRARLPPIYREADCGWDFATAWSILQSGILDPDHIPRGGWFGRGDESGIFNLDAAWRLRCGCPRRAGVTRVKDGQVATLSSRNGLPCDDVLWSLEEQDRSLWICYMACGLALRCVAAGDRWLDRKRRQKAASARCRSRCWTHRMA